MISQEQGGLDELQNVMHAESNQQEPGQGFQPACGEAVQQACTVKGCQSTDEGDETDEADSFS